MDVIKSLSPCLLMLTLLGLPLYNCQMYIWQRFVSFIYLSASLLSFLALLYYINFATFEAISSISFTVCVASISAEVFLTQVIAFWRRQSLQKLLISLNEIALEYFQPIYKQKLKLTRFVLGLMCAGVLTVNTLSAIRMNTDESYRKAIMRHTDTKFGINVLSLASITTLSLIAGFLYATCFLYVTICDILYMALTNVRQLKEKLVRDEKHVQDVIVYLTSYHNKICNLITETDNIFCELFLVWSALEICISLFILRHLNLHLSLSKVELHLGSAACLAYSIVIFVTKTFFAGKVNSQVFKSLKELQPDTATDTLFSLSAEDEAKRKCYIRQVMLVPPALTGWHLFNVSTSTIIIVAGNILTHLLVLYRLEEPPE